MIGDPVIEEMALELKNALLQAGLDPANPPVGNGNPPNERLFAEYQKRGGVVYADAADATRAVIKRCMRMSS